MLSFSTLSAVCLAATPTARWVTSDDPVFAGLSEWSNKVEIGDLDGDDDLDVVIANGGGYSSGDSPEPTRVLLNDGAATFTELVIPEAFGLHRVAKIRDFDGDGDADLFLGGAWMTRSVLLLGDGAGGFTDGSAQIPADELAIGDAEAGDVDDDGDLDLVLADSGPQNALFGDGAVSRLWRNDGTGTFVEDSLGSLPNIKVRWSWDLELVDVDRDYDLDLAISCKTCPVQYLYENDGLGVFTDVSSRMSPSTNNYDFEGLDLTGDGYLDLVTVNDGPQLRERILVNDGTGGFADETASRLPNSENLGEDDNVAVLLDHDDDGDVDILIGSLSGEDRLYTNDGAGVFSYEPGGIDGPNSPGTLGLAAGDLDGDGRLDLVDVQGEIAFKDYLRLGAGLPADSRPPVAEDPEDPGVVLVQPASVHAVVHDRRSPIGPDDLFVTLDYTTPTGTGALPMVHVGHTLFRATIEGFDPGTTGTWHVCATDRAGNTDCSGDVAFTIGDGGTTPPEDTGATGTTPPVETGDTGAGGTDAPPPTDDDGEGCGCASASGSPAWPGAPGGLAALGALLALGRARRRDTVADSRSRA